MKIPTPVPLGATSSGDNTGAALSDSKSSITVNTDDTSGKSNVTITTNSKTALAIDDNQNIKMGEATTDSSSRLVVSEPNGECIEMIREDDNSTVSLAVDPSGILVINTSGASVRFGNNACFVAPGALHIESVPMLASSEQLNYTISSPGTACPAKAMIVDNNLDIANVNSFTATYLTGTLQTEDQPNIRTLRQINIEDHLSLRGFKLSATAEELNYLYRTVPGVAFASRAVVLDENKNTAGINLITATKFCGSLITPDQPAITTLGVLRSLSVDGKIGIGTTAPNTDLEIVSSKPCIRLFNSVVAANLSLNTFGNLLISADRDIEVSTNTNICFPGNNSLLGLDQIKASSITGTLLTARQPQITSLGIVDLLNVAGDLQVGLNEIPTSAAARISIYEPDGKCLNLIRSPAIGCDISISLLGDLELRPSRNFKLLGNCGIEMHGAVYGVTVMSAETISGTITTSRQPEITCLGKLVSLDVENAMTAASVTAETLTGMIQSPLQTNITKVGRLDSLEVINGITAWEMLATSVRADNLTGRLLTPTQPNVTSLGTLVSLTVEHDVVASSVTADTLTGTLQSSIQTNITQVGKLTSLDVDTSVNAKSVTANTLTGTIQSPVQTNIIQIGKLTSLEVDADITASSLQVSTLTGTLLTPIQTTITSVGQLTALDVLTDISAVSLVADTLTGTLQTPNQTNVVKVGTLRNLNTIGPVGIGVADPACALDINTSNLLTTTKPAIRLDDGSIHAQIGVVSDGIFVETNGTNISLGVGVGIKFDAGLLTGLRSLSVSELEGTLLTARQPFITAIGDLDTLNTNFVGVGKQCAKPPQYRLDVLDVSGGLLRLSNNSDTLTLTVANNDFTLNSSTSRLVLGSGMNLVMSDEGTIIGLDSLRTNSFSTSSLTVGGINITASSLASLTGTTAGTVTPNAVVTTDENNDIIGIHKLGCESIAGTMTTAIQANITQVGTLNNLNVKGSVACGPIVATSSTGKCLTLVAPLWDEQVSAPHLDVIVNPSTGAAAISPSSGSLFIDGVLTLPQMILGRDAITPAQAPLEVGSVAFVMTEPYAYNTSKNGHGNISTNGTTAYNYSIRAQGRVLCTQSVDVMSDRRTKTNIAMLPDDYCSAFVENTTPVSFDWLEGDQHRAFGYIAQDLIRAGFPDIVNLVNDPSAKEIIDDDGFINPAGSKFTVTYQHIIPILAKNQQRLMRENAEMKKQLAEIVSALKYSGEH